MKMILTLPTTVDVEKFINFVKAQMLGRYNDHRISNYWLPNLELCGYRGHIKGNDKTACTLYECNAQDLIPPFISVIDSLKNFGMLNYYFTLDGKPVALDWHIEGFEVGGFDFEQIDDATDIWHNRIAQLDNTAHKVA